ncbi:ATP-binding protein [Saccharophagus degradans]|uniref:histidine kinase n=1 Tax=Saccharophagus degradans (strain 2-40 / ATCC 43961 / DSM 17024) TaxID=203122 RepID=Q21FA0_SACD2|nr:ATP-binding protein [Saccharophagus degradans]ABD82629.1 Two-component sensor kinase CbrA [Saccharophagus degradans 2-40]
MTFSFLQVALICFIYLGVLFAIAFATERGWIPNKIVFHPVTYIFSLGIFASAWSFYGVIDLAQNYGYGALAYYLGTGALFLFAPIALKPLIELARRFQINSTADLLTFRYHSHSVGGIITLCMLMAMIPLLVLQIQAVADTIHILTRNNGSSLDGPSSGFGTREILALVYCIVIAGFAMLFGSNREHHKGLITAMAFESLVKMTGLCAVGIFSLITIFGGLDGLDQWLLENPDQLENLYQPTKETSSHTLLLVFVATAVAMPHIFHMTVVENPVKHATQTVTWAFPLFLLVMALPVFPILWAGIELDTRIPAQYFPLAVPIAAGSSTFTIISFVAGLSAATGAMIAIALALATMVLNHWILPATPLQTKREIYGQLIWMRRILIAVVILVGFMFYRLLGSHFNLTDLALTAFIATLQFLPGVIAVAHWSRGNGKGLLAGLFVGMLTWMVGLMIPLVMGLKQTQFTTLGVTFDLGINHWNNITLWSLGLNTLTFVVVSLITKQSDAERYSAELCSEDELSHPIRLILDIRSPDDIANRLALRIGESTARTEVSRALKNLGLNPNESRPYALRRLRDEVEANLSGLMGIAMASEIMDKQIPFKMPETEGETDINLIESRLSQFRDHLTGLAAELNNLRLYHRRTLEELPLSVCSVGQDMEILMWNGAMEALTGIESTSVTGSRLEEALDPWGDLLTRFALSHSPHFYKQEIELAGRQHWINLHKASIPSSLANKVDGQVILLEDVTELVLLEQELVHSERLASIGRLAAGVAHEIGNPVTGIACLAQNMKYETDDPEILDTAQQILSQTDRVSRIVHSLVSFSHAGQQKDEELHAVNLRECAQEAINLLALQIEKKQVCFHNSVDEAIQVVADSQRLIQIFVNLLSNSRDASEPDTNVTIEASQEGRTTTISVTDEGPGIPLEIRDRVLEPFFTTKEPGEGTGLGLAMVYSIVEDHQGTLDIVSPVDLVLQKGTKFVIKLPNSLEVHAVKGNTRRSTAAPKP